MFLLRTIRRGRAKNVIAESWYEYDDVGDVIDKILTLDPNEYQVFTAAEITEEVFSKVYQINEDREREERRELYEKLRSEFETQ